MKRSLMFLCVFVCFAAVLTMTSLAGCGSGDRCQVGARRCVDGTAEVCSPAHDWQEAGTCATAGDAAIAMASQVDAGIFDSFPICTADDPLAPMALVDTARDGGAGHDGPMCWPDIDPTPLPYCEPEANAGPVSRLKIRWQRLTGRCVLAPAPLVS